MKDYREVLKSYNLKATPQRVYMIDKIEKSGHIDIDSLYESLKNIFPYISLATVYKNINSMIDNGFLTEVKIPKHKARYELSKDSHAHLFCTKCGKLEDIKVDNAWIANNTSKESGYNITNTLITFEGVCPSCQKKESR